MDNDVYLTIGQAAKHIETTKTNVYIAIKRGKIPSIFISKDWAEQNLFLNDAELKSLFFARHTILIVKYADVMKYKALRWDRKGCLFENKPLMLPGEFTTKYAAQFLGISQARIHYYIVCKKLPAFRKGHAWIINQNDLENLKISGIPSRKKVS